MQVATPLGHDFAARIPWPRNLPDQLCVAATTAKSDSSAQGQDAVHDLPPYRLKIAVALQPCSEVFTLPTR